MNKLLKKGIARLLKWIASPNAIFVSIILGLPFAIYFPETAQELGPIGTVYLALLQMTVIPVLITAVVSSLAQLVATHGASKKVIQILGVFGLCLFIASIAGVVLALFFRPGSGLSESAQQAIGSFLNQNDQSAIDQHAQAGGGLLRFIMEMVPVNPMAAISEGKHLSILFFSVFLGFALGFTPADSRDITLKVMKAMYEAQLKIIHWTLYGLPIGLFCIFADQIARLGVEVLGAMGVFIVVTLLAVTIGTLVHLIIIWKKSGLTFYQASKGMRRTLLYAFATRSSFATIPSAIESLQKNFSFKADDVNLVVPLGINLNRQGTAIYMALVTLFVTQLFGVEVTMAHLITIVFLAFLTGLIPAELIGLVPLVFAPLGLPSEVGIALILAVDPILDPFLTVMNVSGGCAVTALVSDPEGQVASAS